MFYEKKVDARSRASMTEFLRSHFRYHTGNPWGGNTTYANCVKFSALGLSETEREKAYELLGCEDYWLYIDAGIRRFTEEFNGRFTICSSGRSGGYLVLLSSEHRGASYLSYCRSCGQRNFQLADAADNRCGACGAMGGAGRVNFAHPPASLNVSGRSIDGNVDFSGFSISELRERVDLVRRFDRACDEIRDDFIRLLYGFDVVEFTEYVQVSRRVLRQREQPLAMA